MAIHPEYDQAAVLLRPLDARDINISLGELCFYVLSGGEVVNEYLNRGICISGLGVFISIILVVCIVKDGHVVLRYIRLVESIKRQETSFRTPSIGLCEFKFFLVYPIAVAVDDLVPGAIGGDGRCFSGRHFV